LLPSVGQMASPRTPDDWHAAHVPASSPMSGGSCEPPNFGSFEPHSVSALSTADICPRSDVDGQHLDSVSSPAGSTVVPTTTFFEQECGQVPATAGWTPRAPSGSKTPIPTLSGLFNPSHKASGPSDVPIPVETTGPLNQLSTPKSPSAVPTLVGTNGLNTPSMTPAMPSGSRTPSIGSKTPPMGPSQYPSNVIPKGACCAPDASLDITMQAVGALAASELQHSPFVPSRGHSVRTAPPMLDSRGCSANTTPSLVSSTRGLCLNAPSTESGCRMSRALLSGRAGCSAAVVAAVAGGMCRQGSSSEPSLPMVYLSD